MRNLIKYLLLSLNVLAVVALLLSFAAGFVSPAEFWIPSMFGLAFPLVAGGNIAFIIFWLIFKPRFAFISLIPLIAGGGLFFRFIQFQEKTTQEEGIKILSYNVHHFRGESGDSHGKTSDSVIKFVNEQKPDIICLQEVRLRQKKVFDLANTVNDLDFINHYQYASTSSTFGSVTLSRYPIIRMNEIRFEKSRNVTIYSDILIGTDTVRVFNVHLHSYGIDPKDFGIIESGVTSEKDLEEARIMGSKLKAGFQMRASQVEAISDLIANSPYPIILCGDLNDTPASYSYQQLSSGLNDAFIRSGKGVGRTYINKLPFLRIDYIIYSDFFESFNFTTHNLKYSDHLPISALLLKKSEISE